MAIGLMITVWAAAIHPLQDDVKRQERAQDAVTQSLLKQVEKISSIDGAIVRLQADEADHGKHIQDIYERGSPITDKRLSLLEWRMEHPK